MKPDPVTKLAKRLREIGVEACIRAGSPRHNLPWLKLEDATRSAWKAIARHVLTHYARLTPDARRLLRRVRGRK